MIAILYAIMSVFGVMLAYRRVFHTLIPYGFVAIDMTVIALALTMLARMHNLSLSHEFSLPLFSLAFVILIHAALRYRPVLILFGFTIFVILLFAFPILLNVPIINPSEASVSHTHNGSIPFELVLHDVGFLPLLFLTLATCLLFYIVMRTRSMTELALIDGRRANQLSRFFSPKVANSLTSTDGEEYQFGNRQDAAVIFVDIRGFSRIAERLSPNEVAEFLSAFRTTVCEVIFKYDGTVDKFIGDAVLAVFGTPAMHEDDAKRAISASMEIIDKIEVWSQARQRQGLPFAKIGIGGHYGEVFSGIIESGQILEHSIIGESVNVAERLERLTRELDADFVFSNEIIEAAENQTASKDFKSSENVEIRGHKSRIKIWFG